MVLLKNDGVLPIKTTGTKIAVVGPLANQTRVLLGNYNGIPTHTVSILEGMKKEFAGATINYVPGTGFLSKETQPVPNALLTTDGKPGAKVTYLKHDIVSEEIATSDRKPYSASPRALSKASTSQRSRCQPKPHPCSRLPSAGKPR